MLPQKNVDLYEGNKRVKPWSSVFTVNSHAKVAYVQYICMYLHNYDTFAHTKSIYLQFV